MGVDTIEIKLVKPVDAIKTKTKSDFEAQNGKKRLVD